MTWHIAATRSRSAIPVSDDGSSVTNLANAGNLAAHVDNVAGTYVMRYLNGREILAEGAFTLVE